MTGKYQINPCKRGRCSEVNTTQKAIENLAKRKDLSDDARKSILDILERRTKFRKRVGSWDL